MAWLQKVNVFAIKSTHYFSAFKKEQLYDVGSEIRGKNVILFW